MRATTQGSYHAVRPVEFPSPAVGYADRGGGRVLNRVRYGRSLGGQTAPSSRAPRPRARHDATPTTMRFTWDPNKHRRNLRKHGVEFREAGTVFADPLSTTFPDSAHSHGEERYVTIGISDLGNVLVIAHVDHEAAIRIVSARHATRAERKFYEEG